MPDILRDLAPTGVLSAGINFGNPVLVQRDPATRQPRGVSVDLAPELGQQLHIGVELVTFDAAGKLFDAFKAGAWDVAFMAIDPVRCAEIRFTEPYLVIEGTYMVERGSTFGTVEDVDRENVRIAIGSGGACDLFLSRTLKFAQLVRRPTGQAAFELFVNDGLEAAAGVRQALVQFAQAHPGLRVMDGRFMVIEQAMATPKPRLGGARYQSSFLEDLKRNGFIAEALKRSGQADATLAPAPTWSPKRQRWTRLAQ
jgi:polar amino acid transport system substrate-binding protein